MDEAKIKTLLKTESVWIINKPIRVHFDEIMTQCINWEPVHRLDFETSGCLLFAPKALAAGLRQRMKNSMGVKKFYLAGASKKIPLAAAPPPNPKDYRKPEIGNLVQGFIASRYKSSQKVQFVTDKKKCRGYHSILSCEHKVSNFSETLLKEILVNDFDRDLFENSYQVELISGARHQIRAYFQAQGAALKGDPVYNSSDKSSARLALHAYELHIELEAGQKPIVCRAPVEI